MLLLWEFKPDYCSARRESEGHVTLTKMPVSDIFVGLGQGNLDQQLRTVSLGKLKTYQLFDRLRIRLHLSKLNQEVLRKIAPKVYARLSEKEEDLAVELSQAILVSHLDMIVGVLDYLGIPHQDGFFDKDTDVKSHLSDGWQSRSYEHFQEKYPKAVLAFYLNHLAHEVVPSEPLFIPPTA